MSIRGKKIKIVSSDHPANWYADKIGQEFTVHSHDSRNKDNIIVRTTVEQAGWPHGWVAKKDCEFIQGELAPKEGAEQ